MYVLIQITHSHLFTAMMVLFYFETLYEALQHGEPNEWFPSQGKFSRYNKLYLCICMYSFLSELQLKYCQT